MHVVGRLLKLIVLSAIINNYIVSIPVFKVLVRILLQSQDKLDRIHQAFVEQIQDIIVIGQSRHVSKTTRIYRIHARKTYIRRLTS